MLTAECICLDNENKLFNKKLKIIKKKELNVKRCSSNS